MPIEHVLPSKHSFHVGTLARGPPAHRISPCSFLAVRPPGTTHVVQPAAVRALLQGGAQNDLVSADSRRGDLAGRDVAADGPVADSEAFRTRIVPLPRLGRELRPPCGAESLQRFKELRDEIRSR